MPHIESVLFLKRTRRSYLLAFAQLVCLVMLWCPAPAPAQSVQHTENKPDQALKGDFRIDPSTLGMGITIPLGSYPGRGGLNTPLSLTYSSKVWRVDFLRTWLSAGTQIPFNELSPKYAENSVSGWTSSLDIPLIEFTGRSQYYDNQGQGVCDDCDPSMQTSGGFYIKRIHVHLPDGSSHELRASDDAQFGYPVDFSGVYRSVDAARLIFDAASSTLYLPDGSRYLFASTEIFLRGRMGLPGTTFIDRNGNTLSYNATSGQWTDTLGRAIANPLPAEAPADPNITPTTTYEVKRVGNAPNMVYTFHWKRLADALTTSQSALRYTGSSRCNYDYNPPSVSPALFATSGTDYVCAKMDAGYNAPELFNPVVLSKIDLPTGQSSYTFTYNIYGEIEKVSLPTGGYERYVYGSVPTLSYQTTAYRQANRGALERWVSIDGSSAETRQEMHSVATSSGSYTVRSTASDNTYTERVLHASNVNGTGPAVTFGFDDPLAGKIREERSFNSSNGMLRRTLTKWWTITPAGSTRPRDPYVDKTVSLILDTGGNALAETTTLGYDGDQNVISTGKYDYNASLAVSTAETAAIDSIPNGALVRTDEMTYLVNDVSISSTVRQLYRDRNLTALPSSSRVKNAAGTVVAQSEIKYDEAAYPLLPYASVTSWTDPGSGTLRGLATTTRRWLDTTGGWLETHAQYDVCGNVRKTWDARDNKPDAERVTQVEYSPTYHYAYPTHTVSAVPDPANNRATSAPLETWTTYDFSTGKVNTTTDANGKVTTLRYDANGTPDSLGRLRRVEQPDNGWTEYFYNDTPGNLYVRTRTAINASQWAESYAFFDGLGRSVRSLTNEGGSPVKFITTDTQYDAMGRVWRVSNPYRTNGSADPVNPSGLWTTNAYDALGRVSTVTTPDNAVVSTSYSGNTVTVADQRGKARRSVKDALGRLSAVYEDPAGVNYQTSYSYDVLGNLRKVDQGGQSRFFMYDSLGRLIRARNPEQGNFTADTDFPALTDSTSGAVNSQWSVGYIYDANGNLSKRRDARGVTTTHLYDNLNRLIQTTYSDGTPFTLRTYDFAQPNGRGRFYADYESSTTGTLNYVSAYDAMGRPTSGRTEFYLAGWGWRPAYTTSRVYDLSGHVTAQVYPSGHVVNYSQFDDVGRLKSFSGNLGDGLTRTYATGIGYNAGGGLEQEQFGTQTALHHKLHYNVRGQLNDVRLSTVAWATDQWHWNRGALINYYAQNDLSATTNEGRAASGTDNNGNVMLQQHWVPSDDQISGYQWMSQSYAYDALNRLTSVAEQANGVTNTGAQSYAYDRFGNRTIDAGATWGTGLPEPQFTVDAGTNRLGVPTGQAGVMSYDLAGNLTHDSYTGKGNRTYDAENRMTSAVSDIYGNNSLYTYDAAGKRVRRSTPGAEVWQVYGLDGELLSEYAANAAPAQPQKEYGYRNAELLVTAESGGQVNWLVTDHLGTPRMIADLSGSLAGIKRHDYLPFGEEVGAGVGGRTQAQGYVGDSARQKFTGHERDNETGLDYAQARYYSSAQARFTSTDPIIRPDRKLNDPRGFNLYAYALNNPLVYIDPDGKEPTKKQAGTVSTFIKVFNETPSKMGQQKKADAEKALQRLGETEGLFGMTPKTTPYFNKREGRYIYTEKGGWIDMVHFLFYAGKAYGYKKDGKKNPIGEAVQDGYNQEAFDPKRSAYSYEDLPTDKFGAEFGVNHFDPNSDLTLGEQIQNYLNNELKATEPEKAPNYNKLPDDDTEKPSRKNPTTKPVFVKENP